MRISGISNFRIPTINNRLDFSSLKPAEVISMDIPKPKKKNVYVSTGYWGQTYSNRTMKENMEEFDKRMKNLEIREADWQYNEKCNIWYDSSSKYARIISEMKAVDVRV